MSCLLAQIFKFFKINMALPAGLMVLLTAALKKTLHKCRQIKFKIIIVTFFS